MSFCMLVFYLPHFLPSLLWICSVLHFLFCFTTLLQLCGYGCAAQYLQGCLLLTYLNNEQAFRCQNIHNLLWCFQSLPKPCLVSLLLIEYSGKTVLHSYKFQYKTLSGYYSGWWLLLKSMRVLISYKFTFLWCLLQTAVWNVRCAKRTLWWESLSDSYPVTTSFIQTV